MGWKDFFTAKQAETAAQVEAAEDEFAAAAKRVAADDNALSGDEIERILQASGATVEEFGVAVEREREIARLLAITAAEDEINAAFHAANDKHEAAQHEADRIITEYHQVIYPNLRQAISAAAGKVAELNRARARLRELLPSAREVELKREGQRLYRELLQMAEDKAGIRGRVSDELLAARQSRRESIDRRTKEIQMELAQIEAKQSRGLDPDAPAKAEAKLAPDVAAEPILDFEAAEEAQRVASTTPAAAQPASQSSRPGRARAQHPTEA